MHTAKRCFRNPAVHDVTLNFKLYEINLTKSEVKDFEKVVGESIMVSIP